MNLAALRQEIADYLETATANVYWYVPEVVMPPAVILVPAEPYVEQIVISRNRYRVTFDVTFAVAMQDNQAALNNLETLIFDALAATPTGWEIGTVSRPQVVNLGQADLLSANLQIKVITSG